MRMPTPVRPTAPLRRALLRAIVAAGCAVALSPAGTALAQTGSGVPLGSAKKLSSAPPSSSSSSSVTTATTSSSSSATSAAATSPSSAKRLPYTGGDPAEVALFGGALLLAGLALRVRTRDARSR